jgi:hypothetical protein
VQLKSEPDSASVILLATTAATILGTSFDQVEFVRELESAFESSFSLHGNFATLIHGDLCPTNTVILNKTGDVALLDFEFSRPGHALMDACVFRLGFPTSHYSGSLPRSVVLKCFCLFVFFLILFSDSRS